MQRLTLREVAFIIILLYFLLLVIGAAVLEFLDTHLTVGEAVMYSLDSICCRGRVSDPKDLDARSWCAAAESILGHLFLPLAIATLFAWAQPTPQNPTAGAGITP